MLGAADDRDGRAVDALARALRLIANSWVVVIAARMAAMTIFVGFEQVDELFANGLFAVLFGIAMLSDAAIVASPLVEPYARLSPNRRLALAAPLVLFSGAVFQACAAEALRSTVPLLLAASLGPAMLAMIIFGRLRVLSLAYGMGALLAQLIALPDLQAATPLLVVASGIGIVIAQEWRIRQRDADFTFARGNPLPADRAKALLDDFEKAGHGWFWETDRAGLISYISETLATQMGRSPEELVGTPFAALIATPDSGSGYEGPRTLNFHLSARTAFSELAVLAAHARDEERWWSISGQPVISPFGQYLGFRGSGSDLTEMRRSQAEVARLANVDSLTGLANRPQMMLALEQALAARQGVLGDCALFLLDLDRFKEVNDTMGHPAGDALLKQVAQRLLRIVGDAGKVGRLGGDEFQILLPGMVEMLPIAKIADAIIHSLSEPYLIDGSQVVIGVSIGIALAPVDGTSSETLIRNADLALYVAKGAGRGQFRFFVPAMHAEAEDKRQLEADLRHTLRNGGLHLDYQPVVCAASERITGFEALLRWTHPQRGAISPAVFVPIAEDAGLIGAIGEWVLRTACAEATTWPPHTRLAVNVSPIQFANPSLPAIVMRALANSGLAAGRLELEITESVFLADQDKTDGMFAKLKQLGVRLALDDFGTGYSALGYLKTAPFDKIKIDQSFVRGAAIRGSRNAAIVKSIVNLAEALGMETTAEGAETLDELDLIRSLGCSHIQGYIYGRPMSASAAIDILASNNGHATAAGPRASRQPRMTMLRTVTLRHGGNAYTARVRNISASGALIEGLIDVPMGTVFTVEFGKDLAVGGTCRWSSGERLGLEFDTAVDVERIRAPEKVVLPKTDVPDFYRNGWKRAG